MLPELTCAGHEIEADAIICIRVGQGLGTLPSPAFRKAEAHYRAEENIFIRASVENIFHEGWIINVGRCWKTVGHDVTQSRFDLN